MTAANIEAMGYLSMASLPFFGLVSRYTMAAQCCAPDGSSLPIIENGVRNVAALAAASRRDGPAYLFDGIH
jgi:hypothetical protein